MEQLKTVARIFYGVCVAAIGFLHFTYPGFRPVILPIAPEDTSRIYILIYITGAILFFLGSAITFNYRVRQSAFVLGILLLLFFLTGHVPNRIKYHPEILGMWTDALKLLTLAGGAFIVSGMYSNQQELRNVKVGSFFFAFMLVIFGIDHFLYLDFVKALVPTWIPGAEFWSYFAGVALIGSGVSIFISVQTRLVSLLLAIMLFLWLIILHIPRALSFSFDKMENDLISSFECLAFCGIALLVFVHESSIETQTAKSKYSKA